MRFFYLSLIVFMSSCSGYQHIASPAYVPFNTKKGNLKASVFYNHLQAGYTVSNHVSIFAIGYYRNGGTVVNLEKLGSKEGSGADSYDDKFHEVNAGASYFTNKQHFIYEVHIGGGIGKVHYYHTKDLNYIYSAEFDAHTSNIFIQPSVAYKFPKAFGDHFQMGAFTKVSSIRYYDINNKSSFETTADKEDIYFSNTLSRQFYFIEPGLCIRAGGKHIKGNATLSFPVNVGSNEIRYRKTNLYLSVFFDLDFLID
jgi:hypothetical protein